MLEAIARNRPSIGAALVAVVSGNLFGISDFLRKAGERFKALSKPGAVPTLEVAGEIYVRTVPFANDHLIDKLQRRGLGVYLAPSSEWINYCTDLQKSQPERNKFAFEFSSRIKHRIERVIFSTLGSSLQWSAPFSTRQFVTAATPYLNPALQGEAILTLGGPLCEWRRGTIDGLVNVGPLECMPSRIAQSQLQLISEREGLPSLTLPFNGEPLTETALDDFVFEVKAGFRQRAASLGGRRSDSPCRMGL
jgi:predicted nucleotide-binding protein (sugar kinase/HSP70/actin superfamily)